MTWPQILDLFFVCSLGGALGYTIFRLHRTQRQRDLLDAINAERIALITVLKIERDNAVSVAESLTRALVQSCGEAERYRAYYFALRGAVFPEPPVKKKFRN